MENKLANYVRFKIAAPQTKKLTTLSQVRLTSICSNLMQQLLSTGTLILYHQSSMRGGGVRWHDF